VIKRIHIELLAFIVMNMVFYNTNKINYVNCNDYANGITSTIMLKLNHLHITYIHAMTHVMGVEKEVCPKVN
jgi:hypothetical protein